MGGPDWSVSIPLVCFGLEFSLRYKLVYLQLFSCAVHDNTRCYMP